MVHYSWQLILYAMYPVSRNNKFSTHTLYLRNNMELGQVVYETICENIWKKYAIKMCVGYLEKHTSM